MNSFQDFEQLFPYGSDPSINAALKQVLELGRDLENSTSVDWEQWTQALSVLEAATAETPVSRSVGAGAEVKLQDLVLQARSIQPPDPKTKTHTPTKPVGEEEEADS